MNPTTPSASVRLSSDRDRARFRGSGSTMLASYIAIQVDPEFFQSPARAQPSSNFPPGAPAAPIAPIVSSASLMTTPPPKNMT